LATCALCQKQSHYGRICGQHFVALSDMLDPRNEGSVFDPERPTDPRTLPSVAALYGWLDAGPVRRDQGSPVTSGVFGSRPPCRLEIIALRDTRSRSNGTGPDDHEAAPPLAVIPTLWALVARVDRTDLDGHLEQRPDKTVPAMCGWLYMRREWLAHQPWIDQLYTGLRQLHNQLRGAWGDPAMKPLGPCIQLVDDHGRLNDNGPWSCGWPLFMPEQPPKAMDETVDLPTIRCASCDWTYPGSDLVRLARLQWEARQLKQEAS
jgi:hypothetical protein